jgi:hypothetical protein
LGLNIAESLDEERLRRYRDAGDLEILDASQRLPTLVDVVGNLARPDEILLEFADPGRWQGLRRGPWSRFSLPFPSLDLIFFSFILSERKRGQIITDNYVLKYYLLAPGP